MFRIRPLDMFSLVLITNQKGDHHGLPWLLWSLERVPLDAWHGRLAVLLFYFVFRLFLFVFQLFVFAFFSLFSSQFFAFLMIIFFGEVASGVLVYYQVEEVLFKLNAK